MKYLGFSVLHAVYILLQELTNKAGYLWLNQCIEIKQLYGIMESRQDDMKTSMHFRSERFCLVNGQWFFLTRDCCMGPFANRNLAERELSTYLNELVCLRRFQESRGTSRVESVSNDSVGSNDAGSKASIQTEAGEQSENSHGFDVIQPTAYSISGSTYPHAGVQSRRKAGGAQAAKQTRPDAYSVKGPSYPALSLVEMPAVASRGRI